MCETLIASKEEVELGEKIERGSEILVGASAMEWENFE